MSVIPAISTLQGLSHLPGLCKSNAAANATLYNSTVVLSGTAWSALNSNTDVHTLSWLSPLAQAYAQLPLSVVQQSAQATALLTYEAAAPAPGLILPGLENVGVQHFNSPLPFLADPTVGFGASPAMDNGEYLTLSTPPLCPLPAGAVPGLSWGGLPVAASTLQSHTCDSSDATLPNATTASDQTVRCTAWTQWSQTKVAKVNSSTYVTFAYEPLSQSYVLGTTAGLFVVNGAGLVTAVSGFPTNASVQQLVVRPLAQQSVVTAASQNLTRFTRVQVALANGSAVFNTTVTSLAACFPADDSLVRAVLDVNPTTPSSLAVCAAKRCYQVTLPTLLPNSTTTICPAGVTVTAIRNLTVSTIPAYSSSGSALWLVSTNGSVTYGNVTFISNLNNQTVLSLAPHPTADGVAYLMGSRSSVWRIGASTAVDVSGNLAALLLQEMAQYSATARLSLLSSAFNAASLTVQSMNGSSIPTLLLASPVGVFFAVDNSTSSPLRWTKLGGAARAPVTAASLAANAAWTAASDASLWFADSVYAVDSSQPTCVAQGQIGSCVAADVCSGGAMGSSYSSSCLFRPNTVCCIADIAPPTISSNIAVAQHIAYPAYVASLSLTNDGGLRAQALYKYVNLAIDQLYRSNGSTSSQLLYATDLASCNTLAAYMAVLGQLTTSLRSFDGLSKLTAANIAAAVTALGLPNAVNTAVWRLNFPAYAPRVVAWLLTQVRATIPLSSGLSSDVSALVTALNAQFSVNPGLTASGVTRAWNNAKTVLGCSARTLQPPVMSRVAVAYDAASDRVLLMTGGTIVDASLASATTSAPLVNDAAGVWALPSLSSSMAALRSQRCIDSFDALNPAQAGNCLPGTPGCPSYSLPSTIPPPSNLSRLDFLSVLPGGCLAGVNGCPPTRSWRRRWSPPTSSTRPRPPHSPSLPLVLLSECSVVWRSGEPS